MEVNGVKDQFSQMCWHHRSCDFSWGLGEVVEGLIDPGASSSSVTTWIATSEWKKSDAGNSKFKLDLFVFIHMQRTSQYTFKCKKKLLERREVILHAEEKTCTRTTLAPAPPRNPHPSTNLLPSPLAPLTVHTCWRCLCGCVWTYELLCVWQSKGSFLSLLSTWMEAVAEMEVLMISVLEENRIQSPLPGECRFYDSDFHKSEVTSAHTRCRAKEIQSCVFFGSLKE